MKAIDRSTVRDLGSLVLNGGFMLTINPCSDQTAPEVCQSVVEYASTLPHDGLLVVERTQRRGKTVIDRPHIHWVLNVGEDEAKAIEKKFADEGLDVKLTLVYDPRGLCYYLGKDPDGTFYMMKQEDHTGSGTPPAAIEQQKAVVPMITNDGPPTNAPNADLFAGSALGAPALSFWKSLASELMTLIITTKQLAPPIRIGMTRAP